MNNIQNYGLVNYNKNNLQKNSNVAFKAKFPLKDIEKLIMDVKESAQNSPYLPSYNKLYTLLEYLTEIKEGTMAKLKLGRMTGGGWATPKQNPIIEIDGKIFAENIGGDRGYYWYDTLEKGLLGDIQTVENREIKAHRLPSLVFDEQSWKNRNVTADDIRKLAIDA